MKKSVAFSGFALLALLLAGCAPSDETRAPGEYVGETERLMSDLAKKDVFLRVNGKNFTKADFLVAVSMQDKLRRMCAGDPLTGPNKPAKEYSIWSQPRTLSEVLRHALVRQFAEEHKISATKEEFDGYVNTLLPKLRRKGRTLKSVADEFGRDEGRLFISYVEDDALAQPLRNYFDTDHTLDITDDDVIAVSNRIIRFQERAAASNAVERAALERALVEIKGGADFSEVAKKYSATPNDGEEWGEYLLEEVSENPALVAWLQKADPNAVSGILVLDDGLSIVKIVDLRHEDLPEGQSSAERRLVWKLARISRPFFETADDMTHDEIVKMLSDYRNKKLQEKVGKAIMERAVIEWPCGTNLFRRATAPVKKPSSTPSETKGGGK